MTNFSQIGPNGNLHAAETRHRLSGILPRPLAVMREYKTGVNFWLYSRGAVNCSTAEIPVLWQLTEGARSCFKLGYAVL